MVYDDDVPVPPKTIDPNAIQPVIGGAVSLQTTHRNRVELKKTRLKVLLDLTGAGSDLERPGIDLVTVLDISGSMGKTKKESVEKKNGRIDDLIIAMKFLIRKLSPIDRLSVVTFSNKAERQRPLLPMTEEAQDLIEKDIVGLRARGGTYMALGLQEALRVINDRKHTKDRVAAIMFMSDGDPSDGNAALDVPLGTVPIHTFAVGNDYKSDILTKLVRNGGTNSITRIDSTLFAGSSNLSDAFAKCLGGLLNVAVENLVVTVKPMEETAETEDGDKYKVKSTIDNVSAGLYPQTTSTDGSKTVTFYDLYKQEKRSILVDVGLSQVLEEVTIPFLEVTYTYGKTAAKLNAPPVSMPVFRTDDEPDKDTVKVIVEVKRLETIQSMETAKQMAENNDLPGAKEALKSAKESLDAEKIDDPTKLMEMLKAELQLLINAMKDEKTYNEIGRRLLDAALISHQLQRSGTLGTADGIQMYATDAMKEFVSQGKHYENKQNKQDGIKPRDPIPAEPPTQPPATTPPAPQNPPTISEIAPELTKHIGEAIKSLDTINDSLKAIYDLLNSLPAN